MSDVLLKGSAMIALGAAEGYAFSQVGLLNPQAMGDQMLFQGFIIMKLFFGAVGCSMLFQSIMSIISPKAFEKSRFYRQVSMGYPRAVGGCALLGVGMALAGSGPTLLPSQIGAGVGSALPTLAGMFAGGAAFGLVEKSLFGENTCPIAKPGQKTTLDQHAGTSYAAIAVPFGLALLGGVYGLEQFHPHAIDTARVGMGSWLPIAAGAVIGFNQVPLRYLTADGQGGSTSVMNIISTLTGGLISPRHKMRDFQSAAQVLYVYCGTMLGAYVGATQVGLPVVAGYTAARAFTGGAAMMLGARIAGGCTCGHGISGMSELSVQSIVAAMAIFAGGIATAVGLNVTGLDQ